MNRPLRLVGAFLLLLLFALAAPPAHAKPAKPAKEHQTTLNLNGTVRSTVDGSPVPDATVTVFQYVDGSSTCAAVNRWTGATDAAGTWSVSLVVPTTCDGARFSGYGVQASTGGDGASTQMAVRPWKRDITSTVDLSVTPAVSSDMHFMISGTIWDSSRTSTPAAGAVVTLGLVSSADESAETILASTTTNAEGHYSFDIASVDVTGYKAMIVRARLGDDSAWRDSYFSPDVTVIQTTSMNMTLQPPPLPPSVPPVPTQVAASLSGPYVHVGWQLGGITNENYPRSQTVQCTGQDGVDHTQTGAWTGDNYMNLALPTGMTYICRVQLTNPVGPSDWSSDSNPVELRAAATPIISGTITATGGGAIAGATVRAHLTACGDGPHGYSCGDVVVATAVTDAAGHYDLATNASIVGQTLYLGVSAPGYVAKDWLALSAGGDIQLDPAP